MDELAQILGDYRLLGIAPGDRLDQVAERLGAPDGEHNGLAVISSYGALQVSSWDASTVDLVSLETDLALDRSSVRRLLADETDDWTEDQFGFQVDREQPRFTTRCELAIDTEDALARVVISKRPWGAVAENGRMRSVIDVSFAPPVSASELRNLLALAPSLGGKPVSLARSLNETAPSTGLVLYCPAEPTANAMLLSRPDVPNFDAVEVVTFLVDRTSCQINWA